MSNLSAQMAEPQFPRSGRRRSSAPWRRLRVLLLALCAFGFASAIESSARAADECNLNRGRACANDSICSAPATSCVNGSCQIPCGVVPGGQLDEQPKPALCSLGETCSAGTAAGKTRYFCKPTPFRMDLNMLDSCIYHFVEGIQPDFESSPTSCGLMSKLTTLLDQDGNSTFDISDVDLCIKTFLGEPPCNTATATCPNSQTYCTSDAVCGEGAFCNQDMHRCERECGYIVDRDNLEHPLLDRVCSGSLQTCNYEKGTCRDISLEGASCQLDRDCPTGAYCMVGQCAPRCYRSLDCPSSSWFCGVENTCLPKPKPGAGPGFDPKEYSVLYSVDNIELDPFQNQYDVPLLIMNTKTSKQVFDDPKVAFGYRLETKYERKNSAECNGDLSQLPASVQSDCLIAAEEEFLTLGSPFGTLYATGDAATKLKLNSSADKLSPGLYPVVVTAYFSNGRSASVRVTFKKPSPSGEYNGKVSAYLGSPKAHLSTTGLAMRLYIKTKEQDSSAQLIKWSKIVADNNLANEEEFEDITEGYPVNGFIHASESLLFDNPMAATNADNEIPIKGLYSPQYGRMRLVTVLDLPKAICRNMQGQACVANDDLRAENTFGRAVRRIVELIGPFKPAERTFEGQYRETISGLAPHTFTIEGGFRLAQISQNGQAIPEPPALIAAVNAGLVSFPTDAVVSQALRDAMTASCGSTLANTLSTKAAVDAYLASYGTAPPTFPQVVFEKRIRNAIDTVANSAATLTFTEYLAGQVKFCSPTVTSNCVDQKQLSCGLAFMRRAIVENWFDKEALGVDAQGNPATPPLFCNRSNNGGENNCSDPAKATGAVVFQDHLRFYRELTQTYVYQANGAWSDAFHALYKAQDRADVFGSSTAFDYKQTKLKDAIKNYDAARAEMVGSPAAAVLFSWPMARFQGNGLPWLTQMQSVVSDRLDAWIELADLRRRVLQTADLQKTYTFAKHIMNQEYLTQVYLAELQRTWQKLQFEYAGESAEVLSRGDTFLAKVSDSRNPLGLSPDRVYFENTDLTVTNWQNYRKNVLERVETVKTAVNGAVQNLHGALQARADLESGLLQTEQGRDASIEDICGPEQVDPVACRRSPEDRELATSCVGESCPDPWTCDNANELSDCANVVKLFGSAVDNVSCRADVKPHRYQVTLGRDSAGDEIKRACNHGRVGALLQEGVKLELQRDQIKTRVQTLLRSIAREQAYMEETRVSNDDMVEYLKSQRTAFAVAEGALAAAEATYDLAYNSAKGIECMLIVGMANGTDCPQKALSTGAVITAVAAKYAVIPGLQMAMSHMQRSKEITYQEKSNSQELRQLRLRLDGLVGDVENAIAEYQQVVQQLYNVDLQAADLAKTAQDIASRYKDQNEDLVRRLVGQDSGQTIRANRLVRAADKSFHGLLVDAYKMTRAFIHRYNYADQAEAWTNRVYRLTTVADVEQLVADLTDAERNFCGTMGGDCDAINNRQVFRFSLREQLFPQLKDSVDPTTGNVVYAGEQFHNLITSSTFRRKRVVQGATVERIELPFAIRANDIGTAGSPLNPLMLPRGGCNHVIVADRTGSGGTVAVNVLGSFIEGSSRALQYTLVRGGTDQIRSCNPSGVFVNTFTVGRPVVETSLQASFQTELNPPFLACRNNQELEREATRDQVAGCWTYFARDRSLAAPDWIFTIPLEGQEWVVGIDPATKLPLPQANRPQLEDVVIYLRYNARAVSN
jgi:hypothetical protein